MGGIDLPQLDRQPSDATKALVEEFIRFRGGFVSSFGQCEFLFGRLISRLTANERISFVAVEFPFRVESRLQAVIQAFENESALNPYKEQAFRLASRLKAEIDLRNFLVHGFAKFFAQEGCWRIRLCRPVKDNPWHESEMVIRIEEVPQHVSRMGLLTQESIYFLNDLNSAFELNF
ncbi:MAG: hypothetical protein AAFR33_14895 [Pseudomonadota bacterium]